jgi:hypothetical protein
MANNRASCPPPSYLNIKPKEEPKPKVEEKKE